MWQPPTKCNGQASSRESLLLDRDVLPALKFLMKNNGIKKRVSIKTRTMQLLNLLFNSRDQHERKSRLSQKLSAPSTRNVRMFQPSALRSAMDEAYQPGGTSS
ncbi:hypothetical protein CEXT_19601 [Caerostris extrusa]|uniref:Uncharacterized protein n=1 Tax=Caerostris extrusa TaxID=172846 RepID=A0AAV4TP75_CAEEX|nr:hypothetical protein CEXT_19601 [Caerostris extrusa]